MPSFVDTVPMIHPVEVIIEPGRFTTVGQSVELVPAPAFRSHARLLDVTIFKEVAFDNGASIALGTSPTSAQRETLAAAATIAAGTVGIVKPVSWMGTGGFGERMFAGDTRLFGYLAGGLPTVGRLRVVLSVLYLSPRAIAT